jgi:hypothetical protein
MRLRLTDQPLLLADHPARLLQLFRHRYAHSVDDIQNALFIYQQPAAEENSPPFC